MILFPDANFFLQFRDPAELPWCEVVGDVEELRLLVCRTVQSEIDGLKGDGRDHRAERARKASSRFRDIILYREPLVLREHRPRVTLDFAPRVRPDYPHPTTLDLTVSDDRIVAETMAHATETGEAVALLTGDTGPMMTARDHGLAYHPLPDSWRLPKEADDRDKQIKELTRQLAELKRTAPELVVKATTGKGPLLGPLTVTIVEHPALAPDVVDRLIEQLRARYPMKTDFSAAANPKPSLREPFAGGLRGLSLSPLEMAMGMGGLGTWTPPSEAAIARYQEEAYPRWLEKVRAFLTEVHAHLSAPHGYAVVSVSLKNTGIVPAERLLVEIEALGGLLLAEEEPSAERAPLALPEPPEPPAWRMSTRGSLLSDVMGTVARAQAAEVLLPYPLHDLQRAEHDPHAFYRRDWRGKGPTARWSFQCQEFRHGRDPEVFDVIVFAPLALASGTGAVRFTASARNLPQQVEHVISVRIGRQTGDTGAEVEGLMPVDRLWLRAR